MRDRPEKEHPRNRDEPFDHDLELARSVFGHMLDRDPASWPEIGTTIAFLPIKASELSRTNQATLDAMMEKHPGGTAVVFDYIVARPPDMTGEDRKPDSYTEPPARKRSL